MKPNNPKLGLVVAMILTFLSVSAADFSYNDLEYTIKSANERAVEVYKYVGSSTYCDIPEKVNHQGISYTVTSIGEYAFSRCSGLTSITIPTSVASIGEGAFSYCSGLTSVTISNSVTSIGFAAFFYCSGLIEINVDRENKNYQSIDGVLYDKHVSSLLHYPSGSQRTTFSIPNSVLSIENYAFVGCSRLTSITIPNSVTAIGVLAFSYCSGLIEINIDRENKNYQSIDGVLYDKHVSSLLRYPGGSPRTIFSIPNSVRSIEAYAFDCCSGLTSVTIPNSVTYIGQGAFSYCSGLTSVTIPNSVASIELCAFLGCSGLTSVTIPNSVTYIDESAFEGCSGLTSVTIPNSVTDIGGSAFEGCKGLTSVTIPNSVAFIGDHAFFWCTELASVTIPNSVTYIGDYAFSGCSGLTSVTIPNSVTYIGGSAFEDCANVETVYCQCDEPIMCSENVFGSEAYRNAVLYVPKGSESKYKSTSPWSYFRNIEGIDYSGVDDIAADQSVNEYIVYNLQGVVLLKTDDIHQVEQLPAGIYIVNGKKMIIR